MTNSLAIQSLAQAWADDREAMPDEQREALLDSVRARVDDAEGARPIPRFRLSCLCVAVGMFDDLGLRTRDLVALVEEAS